MPPSNGWLAPGYKPVLPCRCLKALAFSLGYENAAYTAFPQLHSSHTAFDSSLPLKGCCYYLVLTLKRVFKFLYTQSIQCNVMFLLILNVLSYSYFIQPYCTNIISFSPECRFPNLYFKFACLSNIISALFPFKSPINDDTLILGGMITNI